VGCVVGLVRSLLSFAAGVARQFLSKEVADELHSRIPWLTRKIVEQAIQRLPEGQRERFGEEWHSHLEETPGELSKLIVAIGFLQAARQMSSISGQERLLRFVDVVVGSILLAVMSPTLLLITAILKFGSAGPVLDRQIVKWKNTTYERYTFRTHGSSAMVCLFGRFLRRTDMASLPELLNVVRGDMTLFGQSRRRLFEFRRGAGKNET